MLERFDARRRPFDQNFNAAVFKVLDETNDLMPGRCALRKEPIADALNAAADEKSSRDSVGHGIVLVQISFTPGLSQVRSAQRQNLETV